MKWARQILRYLSKTKDDGLLIDGNKPLELKVYSDSDWAGDAATAKSTTGIHASLGGTTIFTRSRLQRKISDSVGMAETYAAHDACRYISWVLGITTELGLQIQRPVPLYVDNKGVYDQAREAKSHEASKHYRLSQAVIREMHAKRIVEVTKIDTSENVADYHTKPLSGAVFTKHRDVIMGRE